MWLFSFNDAPFLRVCMIACMHVCVIACVHVCVIVCVHVCVIACVHLCAGTIITKWPNGKKRQANPNGTTIVFDGSVRVCRGGDQ